MGSQVKRYFKLQKHIFAEKIIIATGSEPSNLNNIKIDEQKIVTSTGALSAISDWGGLRIGDDNIEP